MSSRTRGRGRGGERQHGRRTQFLVGLRNVEVVGPEVVAPDADAVRLVDDQAGDAAVPHQLDKGALAQPFGRDVEQPVAAIAQIVEGGAQAVAFVGAVERDGVRLERRRQPFDLILHQRDQRRDDQREGLGADCATRMLRRLPCPGRQ